jgi:hypothetical protein
VKLLGYQSFHDGILSISTLSVSVLYLSMGILFERGRMLIGLSAPASTIQIMTFIFWIVSYLNKRAFENSALLSLTIIQWWMSR